MRLRRSFLLGFFSLIFALFGAVEPAGQPRAKMPIVPIVVDNFETGREGAYPARWVYLDRRRRTPLPHDVVMNAREQFVIVKEAGNKVLRAYTEGEVQRVSLLNGQGGFRWDLRTHPRLRWDWRALRLPEGANERKKNDTGAAFYVTFGKDWIGRPRSIKYTYSSALPVGTVLKFGPLRVIVAASGAEGYGEWMTIERDVVADYERVFGKSPPDLPRLITLWSDSNDTESVAEVDFDNIMVLPAQ